MLRRYSLPVCAALALAVGWYVARVATSGAQGGDSPQAAAIEGGAIEGGAIEGGAIEGTVTYRPNSKRPWRFSRHYVKQAKSGELAEAVVAIRGKGLSKANAAPATTTIDQLNHQFVPETVAVRQGDSVTFTNSDPATHNVKVASELANFNVTMSPGSNEGYTVKLDRAGGVRQPLEVGCAFHGNMQAWIFVFDHPFFQLTKADGRFRLADVPPGSYELELVHPAGGLHWRERVEVKAGRSVRVDIPLSPGNLK